VVRRVGLASQHAKGPMNEFQLILTNILERRGMSVSDLAVATGYTPLLFESIISGKSRQMPVDFFLRIAQVLNLSEEEKDALVRAWAFGEERQSY
jgi:transcriptional regulator with XRE-family HTH domain